MASPIDRPIDTTIDVVTPENIAFQYELAGPFRRAAAFFIDFLVRLLMMGGLLLAMVLSAAFTFLDPVIGFTLMLLGWFVLEWFYGGIFETYWNGQTPGKRMLGLRVLQTGGQPITGLQAVMRNILRLVDMMPLLPVAGLSGAVTPGIVPTGMVGLGAMAITDRFQRLGDLVCGTMVIVEPQNWLASLSKMTDRRVLQLAYQLPPVLRLSRQQVRAVAAYVDRRGVFSIEHRRDMARHLARPLIVEWNLHPQTDPDHLLCAVYHRVFITDQEEENRQDEKRQVEQPEVALVGQRSAVELEHAGPVVEVVAERAEMAGGRQTERAASDAAVLPQPPDQETPR